MKKVQKGIVTVEDLIVLLSKLDKDTPIYIRNNMSWFSGNMYIPLSIHTDTYNDKESVIIC